MTSGFVTAYARDTTCGNRSYNHTSVYNPSVFGVPVSFAIGGTLAGVHALLCDRRNRVTAWETMVPSTGAHPLQSQPAGSSCRDRHWPVWAVGAPDEEDPPFAADLIRSVSASAVVLGCAAYVPSLVRVPCALRRSTCFYSLDAEVN